MEEQYKKFLAFNWVESKEWQQYYSNLYPTPPPQKILKYKKKFYKLKIDDTFDVNYEPPRPREERPQASHPYNPQSSYNTYSTARVSYSKTLAWLEFIVWSAFIASLFLFEQYVLKLAALGCLLKTFHRTGIPKFNVEYAQNLFFNEYFQLMLYSLLFMVDEFNYYYTVPLLVTYIILSTEFTCTELKSVGILYNLVYPIHCKRVELAQIRAWLMVSVGMLLILGIFLGLNSFILPIFYWQYIRFIYIVNNDFKLIFGQVNQHLNQVKLNSSTPAFVKTAIDKLQVFSAYIVRTEASSEGQAGAANCSIF